MRRLFMLIGTVLGVTIGGFVASIWLTDTTAQSERVIPVRAVEFSDSQLIEPGDSCGMSVDPLRFAGAREQVVITDETGTIVAMANLEGGTWEEDDGLDTLKCTIELEIAVPDAAFYTVYLGEERIRGYAAADFPIDTTSFEHVSIQFD